MIPDERRGEERSHAAFRIAYEYFAHGTKISEGTAWTVNISQHGALVEMSQAVDLDGNLILWITAPFYTLLVQGSVVHSRQQANGMFHVGVRLTDVIEGDWSFLQKYAQAHPDELVT